MSMICSEHNIACTWKEGVSKAGKAYAFWACPEKDSEGNFCKAEKIDDGGETPAAGLAEQARYKAAATPSYRAPQGDSKDWHRVERQHSQEMALRFIEIWIKVDGAERFKIAPLEDLVKTWTDHFLADLDK